MKVAVLGRTQWLLASASRLARAGHEVVLVATAKAQLEYIAKEADFARLASDLRATFLQDPDVNGPEFRSALAASRAEIGVSVNWPSLVREDTCAALRHGILNGHAGDLPRYRGNACPNWAILNNESEVGLCIHAMDPLDVDAGPVYARRYLPINEETYISEVYEWIEEELPEMFFESLGKTEERDFKPERQADRGLRPLRCHPRRPEDGRIDFTNSAERIARLVRASSRPFAGSFGYLEGTTKVTIWRARIAKLPADISAVPGQIIGRRAGGGVLVACGHGIIEIEEATLENGAELPATNRFRLQSHRGGSV